MTQKEANQKAKELYDEWNFKHDEIERRAKKSGEWKKMGLDANRDLFEELWKETLKELEEIKAAIDE